MDLFRDRKGNKALRLLQDIQDVKSTNISWDGFYVEGRRVRVKPKEGTLFGIFYTISVHIVTLGVFFKNNWSFTFDNELVDEAFGLDLGLRKLFFFDSELVLWIILFKEPLLFLVFFIELLDLVFLMFVNIFIINFLGFTMVYIGGLKIKKSFKLFKGTI